MFGISTFCLHNKPLAVALEQLAPHTDYIEVMDEGLHYLRDAELLHSYSFRYSIHAPSRGTNLASLLEPIRRASVEVMGECFSIAAEVNAGVVIHPGYFAWAEERREAEQQFFRSRQELKDLADAVSVAFSFENMGNWEYFLLKTPEELSLIRNFRFTLDIGHAHQNRCLAAFLNHKADHYHLHDNNGTEDAHDPVGNGTIDFGPVMQAVLKNGVTPVIEVATFEGTLASMKTLEQL